MNEEIKSNIQIPLFKNKGDELTFVIYDNEGSPVDLTGLTGKFQVYLDTPQTTDVNVIDKALVIPTQEGTSLGKCTCSLDDDDLDIDTAIYNYKLVFVYGVDDNRILQTGTVNVIGDDNTRIEQIKKKYGLTFDYYTMRTALNFAHKQMLSYAYVFEELTIPQTDSNDQILIENYVMDSDFDNSVTSADIDVFEYQKESPYDTNDLTANVSAVTFNHPNGKTILTMDGAYPTDSTYTLMVKYYRGIDTFSNLNQDIMYLEEMFVLLHLFSILSPYKLQYGITRRSINGVKVEFNFEAIQEFKSKLNIDINQVKLRIRGLTYKNIIIDKDYGDPTSSYDGSRFTYNNRGY